jgi:hypothetical protein
MVNVIGRRIDIQPVGTTASDSNLGNVFAQLGQKLFGDTLTPALKAAKLNELTDQNDLLRAAVANVGPDGNPVDPRISSIGALGGATDPAKFAAQRMIDLARTKGINSVDFTAAAAGAGKFRDTPTYAGQEFANKIDLQGLQEDTKLKLADNELTQVLTPTGPQYARKGAAVGQSPILSTDQLKATTLAPLLPGMSDSQRMVFGTGTTPTLVNATGEGGETTPAYFTPYTAPTNAQTQEAITKPISSVGTLAAAKKDDLSGGSGDVSKLLERRTATAGLLSRLDSVDQLLSKPDAGAAVGPLGKASVFFNDLRAQTESAFRLGGDQIVKEANSPAVSKALDGAIGGLFGNAQFNARAQQLGIDASVLRSQITALAYDFAKASDPSGRTSDRDVANATSVVGAALLDPVAGRQVLKAQRDQVVQQHGLVEDTFKATFPQTKVTPWAYGGGAAPVTQPGAPTSATAPAAPAGMPAEARQAADGKFYVPDPSRPGKYMQVVQ